MTGSLKDSRGKLPVDKNELKKFKKVIGSQKVWLAASTHPGEDEVILAAHKKIGGILLIAPRHIERAKQIAKLSRSLGFNTQLRSEEPDIKAETTVYIADTMGEMGLWYSLSTVAFIAVLWWRRGGTTRLRLPNLIHLFYMDQTLTMQRKIRQFSQAGICFLVNSLSDIIRETLRAQNLESKVQFDLNSLFDPEKCP